MILNNRTMLDLEYYYDDHLRRIGNGLGEGETYTFLNQHIINSSGFGDGFEGVPNGDGSGKLFR